MIWITLKRVVRAGFFNFWRNGFVSLSSVLVMVVTLFVIGSTIFSGAILRATLDQIKEKVDVNVYFVTSAPESEILSLKKTIEQLPEVAPPVTYISRDQALVDFRKRHENDQFTLQALDELGENPLGATLNVRAKDPSQYESIMSFFGLKGSDCTSLESKYPIIDKVNYCQNKDAINRLSRIITSANKLGFVLTLILIILSVMITLNTIRLVIFMSKEEISVMRLVGASTGYIRGPFFVAGGIYGFVSGLIVLILFYPITLWLGTTTANFFVGFNVFHYYTSNFGQIFLIVMLSGVGIGSISSYLAVRKYLKV